LPTNLALTVEKAEDIMFRQAVKMSDPDDTPIEVILLFALEEVYSCN
jgi:hypothetical protein